MPEVARWQALAVRSVAPGPQSWRASGVSPLLVARFHAQLAPDRRDTERSEDVRGRVLAARERQMRRFGGGVITCNADMGPKEVRQFCEVEPAAQPLLKAASQRLQLSARAFHRVLKPARTIADLAGAEIIAAPHLAEALQYRPRVDAG